MLSPDYTQEENKEYFNGRHVLFALDESTHSTAALAWVFDSLVKSQADMVTVVVVIPTESEQLATISRVKTLLRAMYPAKAEFKMAVKVLYGFGSQVGPLICKQAEESKPDLLVLGSAGKSHVEGFFVGSVSQYCVAHANCPVIVSRMAALDERGRANAARKKSNTRIRSRSPIIF